jgi:hypothetical protein
MIQPPPIEFSHWVPWKDRGSLKRSGASMGVYLWAHFHDTNQAQSPPYPNWPRDLVYVGEANDVNVRPLGTAGQRHHRLTHYRRMYQADSELRLLYISVFHILPFERDPHCHAMRAYTRFIESQVQWEYTQRHGERPALDFKTGKEPWLLTTGSQEFPGNCCASIRTAV